MGLTGRVVLFVGDGSLQLTVQVYFSVHKHSLSLSQPNNNAFLNYRKSVP